jgi:hypothetical protein
MTPILRRQRQEDCKNKAWGTCLKKNLKFQRLQQLVAWLPISGSVVRKDLMDEGHDGGKRCSSHVSQEAKRETDRQTKRDWHRETRRDTKKRVHGQDTPFKGTTPVTQLLQPCPSHLLIAHTSMNSAED